MAGSKIRIEKRNVKSVLQGIKQFNERKVDAFIATLADDFTWDPATLAASSIHGKEASRQAIESIYETLPGVLIKPPTIMFASHNQVFTAYDMVGDMTNGFMNLPPTDKPYILTMAVVNVFNNSDGKRTASVFYWAPLQLAEQLGAIPKIDPFRIPNHSAASMRPHEAKISRDTVAGIGALPGLEIAAKPRQPDIFPDKWDRRNADTLTDLMMDMVRFPFRIMRRSIRVIIAREGHGEPGLR